MSGGSQMKTITRSGLFIEVHTQNSITSFFTPEIFSLVNVDDMITTIEFLPEFCMFYLGMIHCIVSNLCDLCINDDCLYFSRYIIAS